MKLRVTNRRNAAMTLFEVGVVVAMVTIAGVIFLLYMGKTHRQATTVRCVDNLGYRLWEGDHGAIFPMGISVTNGGSRDSVTGGDVMRTFQVMSNELVRPGVLICPQDRTRGEASVFRKLYNYNVSYLVNLDATNEVNSQRVLSGDANFESNGVPEKSGFHLFGTNETLAWSVARHDSMGNIGFADGSVEKVDSPGLNRILRQTGMATNRFAIP